MRNGLNSPCNNYCINKTALKYNQSLEFLHKFSNKDPWLGGPQDHHPPMFRNSPERKGFSL